MSERDRLVVHALQEAKNALMDYIETLEKAGASLNYGHGVLAEIDTALEMLTDNETGLPGSRRR